MRAARSFWLGLILAGWASTVAGQTISSAANQTFVVGASATAMSPITVTDAAAPQITAGNDIRILIPATFNMVWNTAITTATIAGTGASKVSTTVTYENAGKTLVVNVTTNFAGGNAITISGLQFTNFSAASAAARLGLNASGSGNPATANDDKTITIVAPGFTESANQTFSVGDPATAMTSATITDNGTISAANDIRLQIPAGFNMVWNTSLTTATIGGGAAGKVSTTVSYENAGQVLVLNVTSDFVAGDQITVSGLQFTSFSALSAASSLQLVVSGAGGGTAATSNRTKTIGGSVITLSSAGNQTFAIGDPSTAASQITVTDAATPRISAANDLRIRIPAGFNMTWNTTITTATRGGSAAGKVAAAVTYEDGGRTLVLDVTANFAGGDVLTVTGLQFSNFVAVSAASNLQAVVAGPGALTAAADNRTKTITGSVVTLSSAANQTFAVGDPNTVASTITVTDASGTARITAANDLRVRIPAGFNMMWNTAITTVTRAGSAAGKVAAAVTYEDAGRTLVINVTGNFATNDVLIISGLQFSNFTVASAASNLQGVVAGAGGATAATDNRTKTIAAPTIASGADQTFYVGDPATTVSPITILDAASPTIQAATDIRVNIPAGVSMTWDPSVTTATITGTGSGKVSPAVTYENGNKTLVLNVTANFAAGDQIVVSGLRFASFTAVSALDYLRLEIRNNGLTTATDSRSVRILPNPYLVSVTPDTVKASRLPSNGTNYTASFTVTNSGTVSDSYDLLTTTPLTAITVISITGTGVTQAGNPDSARLGSTGVGGSSAITVTYSVGNVAAGSTDTLILTARSLGSPAARDDGRVELTVIRPGISVSKAVTPNGTQLPGTDLTYSVTLTNAGSAGAAGVVTVDTLPATVMFKVASVVNTLPSGFTATVAYSNDGGTTWTYVPASQACGAPAGFDRCVNRVRWTFTGGLSAVAPDNTARLDFISRIR